MSAQPKPRVTEVAPGQITVEFGISYRDGYEVEVWWEDETWYARLTGGSWGGALADGPTKERALLSLCCSLAATCDAIDEARREASTPATPKVAKAPACDAVHFDGDRKQKCARAAGHTNRHRWYCVLSCVHTQCIALRGAS